MERICAECKKNIVLDKNNSHKAIQYKKKFYHLECFNELCDKRIAHKNKAIAESWQNAKISIDELILETTKELQFMVAKGDITQWMTQKYDISLISNRIYIKLSEIYNGAFRGQAYKIGPTELLEEWKYYWNELCSIRQYKNIIGEQAINYDLTILLNKNAEYRRIKEKERIAREIREQQREESKIDTEAMPLLMKNTQRKNTGNRRASLFEEVMGDGE